MELAVKFAVQDVAPFMVTEPEVQPEPLQPAKVEPEAGVAVRVTTVPLLKFEEQVEPQLMPAGELVTVPLPVPVEDRLGEEGKGFACILHGMNPERVLIAAESVGLGHAALARAAQYARERIVFGRPIGQNQGVQHPLAESWMELEAARLMAFKAADLYDRGRPCGAEANAAKYLAGEACFNACQRAVMTHGGFGYAREYHVQRYLRESLIGRIAPVSPQLVLCFIAGKVLGLPKSS